MRQRIFSTDSSKALKSLEYGYLNAIHYMAPADTGGVGNLCPFLSTGCKNLCLGRYSGQAALVKNLERGMNNVRRSRRDKARRFMRDRTAYMADVVRAIELAQARAGRLGLALCVRMNGSTDIAWEGIRCQRRQWAPVCGWYTHFYANVFEAFPAVQFVDYTKNPARMVRQLPANYHLTFSRSETNEATALELLAQGHNVAVVFAGARPLTWQGYVAIDGDGHDLRHLDPRAGSLTNGHSRVFGGYVVALSPKGSKAKKDTSGFVVRLT